MAKILLTHFDAFGDSAVNSSKEAVCLLAGASSDLVIEKLEVATVYSTCAQAVTDSIDRCSPDIVLMCGQATGRPALSLEFAALNWDDSGAADNAGELRSGKRIVCDGPDALFATLPVYDMVGACREAGIPAAISFSAGTYVCNHLMYEVLYHIKTKNPAVRAGFLHIPATPSQAAGAKPVPCLPSEVCAEGILVMLETAARGGYNGI